MCKNQEALIGICGGVGPAAGLLLHQNILENTLSDGIDQGHFNVCHMSRSEDMTDRTEYLQYINEQKDEQSHKHVHVIENPAYGMARTFGMIHTAALHANARLIIGVPCNTFHAPPIWNEFIKITKANELQCVNYVHMLEETVRFISEYVPLCQHVGLMTTTGTRESRIYHDLMEPLGYNIIEVSRDLQKELHESVYNKDWGIKSTAPAVHSRSLTNFKRYAHILKQQGAEVIVMGCTEIPFAFRGQRSIQGVLLIDPMVALARGLIREADSSKLKPLAIHTNRTKALAPVMPSPSRSALSTKVSSSRSANVENYSE